MFCIGPTRQGRGATKEGRRKKGPRTGAAGTVRRGRRRRPAPIRTSARTQVRRVCLRHAGHGRVQVRGAADERGRAPRPRGADAAHAQRGQGRRVPARRDRGNPAQPCDNREPPELPALSRNAAGTGLPAHGTAVSRFIRAPKSLLAKWRMEPDPMQDADAPARGWRRGHPPASRPLPRQSRPQSTMHTRHCQMRHQTAGSARRQANSMPHARLPPVRAVTFCRTDADPALQTGFATWPGRMLVGASNPAKTRRLRGYIWFNWARINHTPRPAASWNASTANCSAGCTASRTWRDRRGLRPRLAAGRRGQIRWRYS